MYSVCGLVFVYGETIVLKSCVRSKAQEVFMSHMIMTLYQVDNDPDPLDLSGEHSQSYSINDTHVWVYSEKMECRGQMISLCYGS